MKMLIQGRVQGVINSTYEDKKTKEVKITKKIQFLMEDEEKGIKVIGIKMLEEQDISEIKKGSVVSVEIKVSTMKDSFDVFYAQVGKLSISK